MNRLIIKKPEFIKEKRIGEGTYSRVYKCTNKCHGEVAMKRFKNTVDEEDGIQPTVLREICYLKHFSHHKNIVNVIHFDPDYKFVVMQYYPLNLKEYIKHTTLNLENIRNIGLQILKGIDFMHSHGFMHRDLKPQNILVDHLSNAVVLADFGLVTRFTCKKIPREKTIEVCTLWYRPPELLLGDKHYTTFIDIWSFGCILYEIFSQKPLFPGDCEIGQLYCIFKLIGTPNEDFLKSLPNWKDIFPKWDGNFEEKFKDCDQNFKDVLKKCLILDPTKRYSTIDCLNHKFFDNNVEIQEVKKKYRQSHCNQTIQKYWSWMEITDYLLKENPLEDQIDITPSMRSILLDWLIEVQEEYHLSFRTLFRCQMIMDYYMIKRKDITRQSFQLLGIASLQISSKMEEIFPPGSCDFIYISDNTYRTSELTKFEKEILNVLDFNLYFLTFSDFVDSYVEEDTNDIQYATYMHLYYLLFDVDLLVKYSTKNLVKHTYFYVKGESVPNDIEEYFSKPIHERWELSALKDMFSRSRYNKIYKKFYKIQ